MKKTVSSGSLPEIAQAIDRAYDLAFSLVSRLRFAESFATQAAELTAIDFFPDEEQQIAESIARAKGRLFDRRSDLQDLCSLIDADLEELVEAFNGVTIEVFGFSYEDTKDFKETGDPSVYGTLTKINGGVCYEVKRWISETLGFLSLAEQLPVKLDLSLRQKCNDLADGFPMNHDFERAVRKRILFEKSVLTRNAKAFAETKGIIGSTTVTTPKGRKKPGKTPDQTKRERAYLSLLAEYEKWQDKQAKRSGPGDWFEARSLWSSKSKTFFKQLCGEDDLNDSESVILRKAIRNAQTIARRQASGD
jgi:hypothetical protein